MEQIPPVPSVFHLNVPHHARSGGTFAARKSTAYAICSSFHLFHRAFAHLHLWARARIFKTSPHVKHGMHDRAKGQAKMPTHAARPPEPFCALGGGHHSFGGHVALWAMPSKVFGGLTPRDTMKKYGKFRAWIDQS